MGMVRWIVLFMEIELAQTVQAAFHQRRYFESDPPHLIGGHYLGK